jgi:hypothetical protein
MKKMIIIFLFLNTYIYSSHLMLVSTESAYREGTAQWLVVGAGPAGIATIGVLLALGVAPKSVIWVDPEFNAGRIGQYYTTVPANNSNKQFIDFVNACAPFKECHAESLEKLRTEDPSVYSELGIIVPALQDLSAFLRTKVTSYQGWLKELHFSNETWCAKVGERNVCACHVVLATGSHPRELNYENVSVIPLDHALDKKTLATYVAPENTIGVIGGSHSGVLILRYLYELNIKKIINLYRSPIVYTIDMGGWNLNAYNGLKGSTAEWAREVLEGPNPPKNILRVYNNEASRAQYLPECDKIIYSVGYERNEIPLTEEYQHLEYDDTTGIIAPRLFGIGIAFPEYYCDPLGNEDYRVGLKSFMDYAQRIIPQWVNGLGDIDAKRVEKYTQQKKMLEKFANLFTIDIL